MVDVGGASTLTQSLKAARVGANIVMVGVLGGLEAPLQIGKLIAKQPRLLPIAVGSREMQLAMCRSIAEIGSAHVCTPVTNAPLVCRLLLEKKKLKTHIAQ